MLNLFVFIFSLTVFSQDIELKDYKVTIRDILKNQTTKEQEFKKLNRSLIKMDDSICSNKAQMWAWDWKLRSIDSAKIFMFFTPRTSRQEGMYWWYHTAPLLNEKGQWWVMDGGYPHRFKNAVSLDHWLKNFNGSNSRCKEIKMEDADLAEKIFLERSFPETTAHGSYQCYYRITPPGFWTPNQVAINLLGRNAEGTPVNFQRDEIQKSEVYSACLEAATTPIGYALGSAKRKCSAFVRRGSQN